MDLVPGVLLYKMLGYLPLYHVCNVEAMSTKIRSKLNSNVSNLTRYLRKEQQIETELPLSDCKRIIRKLSFPVLVMVKGYSFAIFNVKDMTV